MVVCEPNPASCRYGRRLKVGLPVRKRSEGSLNHCRDRPVRLATHAADVVKIEFMILDAVQRKTVFDLQFPYLAVRCVGFCYVGSAHGGERGSNFVNFTNITLVQAVVSRMRLPA